MSLIVVTTICVGFLSAVATASEPPSQSGPVQPVAVSVEENPATTEMRSFAIAFATALRRDFPGALDADDFVSVDVLPITVNTTPFASDGAERAANCIPSSIISWTSGTRTVSRELQSVLSGVIVEPSERSREANEASRVLYRPPPPGALLRGRVSTFEVTPVCLEYLRTSESVLDDVLKANAGAPTRSNRLVDALLNIRSKSVVVPALQSIAADDVRTSYWKDVLGTIAAMEGEAEAEAATFFEPSRGTWDQDTNWCWIEFDVSHGTPCKARMQVFLPKVRREWFSWEMFQRQDWQFRDGSLRHRSVGMATEPTTWTHSADRLLEAVPVRLILVRKMTIEGNMETRPVLSRWQTIAPSEGGNAVLLGAVCRKVLPREPEAVVRELSEGSRQ